MTTNAPFSEILKGNTFNPFPDSVPEEELKMLLEPGTFGNLQDEHNVVRLHYRTFIQRKSHFPKDSILRQKFTSLQEKGYCILDDKIEFDQSSNNYDVDQLVGLAPKRINKLGLEKEYYTAPIRQCDLELIPKIIFGTGINKILDSIFFLEGWEISHAGFFFAKRKKAAHHQREQAFHWHREGMGRLLKIWLVIHTDEYAPKTCLLTGSNYQDPMPRNWEMLRTKPDFMENMGAKLLNTINNHKNFKEFLLPTGSVYIVDTNTVHRGDYEVLTKDVDNKARVFLELRARGRRSGLLMDLIRRTPHCEYELDLPSDEYRHIFAQKLFAKDK